MFHFYNSWKHKKTAGFDEFMGYRIRALAENELMSFYLLWKHQNNLFSDIFQENIEPIDSPKFT